MHRQFRHVVDLQLLLKRLLVDRDSHIKAVAEELDCVLEWRVLINWLIEADGLIELLFQRVISRCQTR